MVTRRVGDCMHLIPGIDCALCNGTLTRAQARELSRRDASANGWSYVVGRYAGSTTTRLPGAA